MWRTHDQMGIIIQILGLLVPNKAGMGKGDSKMTLRIRQQTALVNSIKFSGASSSVLRRILFSTFVLPFFTWLVALHPLFTDIQQSNLNHFYYTSRERVYHCLHSVKGRWTTCTTRTGRKIVKRCQNLRWALVSRTIVN